MRHRGVLSGSGKLTAAVRSKVFDRAQPGCYSFCIVLQSGGAVAQLGARLDGIEEVVGSNPIGSTI